MGCDDDIVKCLVFWANFLLALVGISVISVGIVYKVNLEELSSILPKEYQNIVFIPIVTIPLGSIIIAVAVFGCYGCITERSGFLTVYGGILLLVFLCQVVVGICSFFQIGDKQIFDKQLNGTLSHIFSNYAVYENKEVVDLIQHRLRCCGLNGSSHWNTLPKSCFETDTKNIYKEPCSALVSKYVDHCIKVVGIMSLFLSITEISGSIISLVFANSLRSNQRRYMDGKVYSIYHFGNGII